MTSSAPPPPAAPETSGHADLATGGAPILVEVTRGGMVESRHRGRAAIVDADGAVLAHWGDLEGPVYGRSAIKAFQAIPLVESGALDAFGLGEAELALACASHRGEPLHTGLVAQWLARIGCTGADLECGAHMPYDEAAAASLIRSGAAPTALHNNCSGKHAGFLTTARHKREGTRGYVRFDHPVQQRILGVLEQITGQDLTGAPRGIDGCAIPTIGVPLGAIAYGMARIAEPGALPTSRAVAVARIRAAWAAHPELISGSTGFDTRIMRALGGAALVKGGAEGVMAAVLPEKGLGIALKIEDGAARAAQVAVAALLRFCGIGDDAVWAGLGDLGAPPVTTRNGAVVGAVRAAPGWPH